MTGVRTAICSALVTCAIAAAQDPRVTRADASSLARELDRSFDTASADDYIDRFSGSFPRRAAALRARLEGIFARSKDLRRSSTVESFELRGDVGIAHLRSQFSIAGGAPYATRDSFLVLGARPNRAGAGGAVAEFEVEFSAAQLAMMPQAAGGVRDTFRCPACNYRFVAPAGWLVVPNDRRQTACLESLTFYSLAVDVDVGLSVHTCAAVSTPQRILREFAARAAPDAAPGLEVADWVPPRYGSATMPQPTALHGARCTLARAEGEQSTLYVATFGRLCYLIVVSGAEDVVGDHAAEIAEFLRGFELLDPDLEPAAAAPTAVGTHTGSHVSGVVYVNDVHGVRFAGVGDWPASLDATGAEFEVTYRCPQGRGTVSVTGRTLPAWSVDVRGALVDGMVVESLGRDGLEVVDEGEWTRNSAADVAKGRFEWERTMSVRRQGGGRELRVRLLMEGDLLVVLEAEAEAEILGDLLVAFDGLTRVR